MKKKSACSTNKLEVFIAGNYCNQNEILKSKQLSLKENAHLRENNDRVSLIIQWLCL